MWNPCSATCVYPTECCRIRSLSQSLEVRQQQLVVPLLRDRRMQAEERLRVRAHVDARREVVRLVLGPATDERGVLLPLVQVERQPRAVVEDLREPPETVVGGGVLLAHDRDGVGCRPPPCSVIRLRSLEREVAQPLVGGSDRLSAWVVEASQRSHTLPAPRGRRRPPPARDGGRAAGSPGRPRPAPAAGSRQPSERARSTWSRLASTAMVPPPPTHGHRPSGSAHPTSARLGRGRRTMSHVPAPRPASHRISRAYGPPAAPTDATVRSPTIEPPVSGSKK